MPTTLKVGISQSRTLPTTRLTLLALTATVHRAASQSISLLLFPEAYLGGYPRTCSFGAAVGSRTPQGRDQFLHYFRSAVDLGDTPAGGGEAWINGTLPLGADGKVRGDGTRETLERLARETGVFIVTGLVERAGGTLYCSVVYVSPTQGCIGKRRKVMPTGTERLVWGQGQPSTLKAVVADINGVRVCLAAAICWENYMPLLRYSLYSQNVNLWLAPTADPRETWAPLMQTVAMEGRCFVLSANQCVRFGDLPWWITGRDKDEVEAEIEKELGAGAAQVNGGGKVGRSDSEAVVANGDGTTNGAATPTPMSPTRISSSSPQQQQQQAPHERRRSMTTKTADGEHDIVWRPSLSDSTETEHPTANAKTTATVNTTDNTTTENTTTSKHSQFESRGGSCIVSPLGQFIVPPVWEVDRGDESLISAVIDFDDCDRGRLDFDAAGSYSRSDSFRLSVEGLDLSPPV